jgi:hypothetical protein
MCFPFILKGKNNSARKNNSADSKYRRERDLRLCEF